MEQFFKNNGIQYFERKEFFNGDWKSLFDLIQFFVLSIFVLVRRIMSIIAMHSAYLQIYFCKIKINNGTQVVNRFCLDSDINFLFKKG